MTTELEVTETPNPPVEESTAPPATEEPGVSGTPTTEETPPEPPKKGGVQERIDELTRKSKEAEREAEYWKTRALQAPVAAAPAAEPEPEEEPKVEYELPTRPSRDDYDDYEDYELACDLWAADVAEIRLEAKQRAAELKRVAEANKAKQAQEARAFEDWKGKGTEKFSDFDEVALRQPKDGGPEITAPMADAIKASDLSHEIAYFLGKNPKESVRIAGLPPAKQIMEIGKLEARLATGPPPPKKSTDAPPPIQPVPVGPATVVDAEKLSTAEWMKRRNAGEIR